jgi:hypothetical protein
MSDGFFQVALRERVPTPAGAAGLSYLRAPEVDIRVGLPKK